MDKQLTDRRQNTQELIAYYEHQAQLAEKGLTHRRSAEFYRRQVQYLTQEGAR